MNTGGDENQEIPGYLFFAPDSVLRPLRSDPDYLEAITQADSRGPENKLYTGSYAKWDNNIIANHNVIIDTAAGRQGSPLQAAYISPAILDNVTVLLPDADTGSDEFVNFLNGNFNLPGGGGGPFTVQTSAKYIMIIDANDDNVRWYTYTVNATGSISGLTFHDPDTAAGGAVTAGINGAKTRRGSNSFAAGSRVYQCNDAGTPIAYALMMGENALYYAKGAVTNEQIFHYDDFANSGNDAHLSAVGVQSVYGMAAYQDTNDRIPGVQLVECVQQVPGLSIAVA